MVADHYPAPRGAPLPLMTIRRAMARPGDETRVRPAVGAPGRKESIMTPEQAKWQAENLARRARQSRMIADRLETWRHCPRKPCRRSSACLGPDPVACARHLVWDVLDETERAILQHGMQLRAGGASAEDALREAQRRVAAVSDGP